MSADDADAAAAFPQPHAFAASFGWLDEHAGALDDELQSLVEAKDSSAPAKACIKRALDETLADERLGVLLPEFRELHRAISDHVLRVFVCLRRTPELAELSALERSELLFGTLLHDIDKKRILDDDGEIVRDVGHPFRCAGLAARVVERWGWATANGGDVSEFVGLCNEAFVERPEDGALVHDNSKLPRMLAVLDQTFDGPAKRIVKLVLLHQSLPSLDEFPPAAPLTEADMRHMIDGPFLRLLTPLMLADSHAYQLNSPEEVRERYLREIRANLARVRSDIIQQK